MALQWFVGYLGQRALDPLRFTFHVFGLVYTSIRAFFINEAQGLRAVIQVISQQVYFTGFQALPLISVLGLATGGLVIMQSSAQLSLFGGQGVVGDLLVALVLRELAPLMTALVVVARSGTAVASELGNMKVHREIEALEVMGIHPLSYVVFPRLVGGVISLMCLGVYFALIAFLGGFLISKSFHHISFDLFLNMVSEAITPTDVVFFFLKLFVAGLLVFSICCHYGLSVHRGSYEVPQVATKAVVHSLLAVISFQVLASFLFYLDRLIEAGIL